MSIAETAKASGLSPASTGMSRLLTFLFAVAAGGAVGNLYWAQPLLTEIAATFGVSSASAGALITATQLGYVVGVLLIVPLGDTLSRRRLIPGVMIVSAAALSVCALAPSFAVLLLGLSLVGLTTVAGQMLVPLAGDLAVSAQRGRVVGTVISGILTGIMLSRTISGFFAHAFGWHAIFAAAAVFSFVMALLLSRALPAEQPRPAVSYGALLRSVFTVVRKHRAAQASLVISALSFSVFTMFWTALTFLLSAAPFSYTVSQIGLVGLVGLAGALAAQRAGWLHDHGWSVGGTGAAVTLGFVSLVIAAFGSSQILIVLVAVFLLDVAVQMTNVLNQTRLFSIDHAARSRLNTAFVASNFIGGAIGSALAGVLWQAGGWTFVATGGAVLLGVAFVVWLTQRKALKIS